MTVYNPDCWVIVKVSTPRETFYKVLAGWYGGFAGSDQWKMNSGITRYKEENGVISFSGYSGSTYKCGIMNEYFSSLTRSTYEYLQEQLKNSPYSDSTFEHISYEQFKEEFRV